jgi:hypothetical protein
MRELRSLPWHRDPDEFSYAGSRESPTPSLVLFGRIGFIAKEWGIPFSLQFDQ